MDNRTHVCGREDRCAQCFGGENLREELLHGIHGRGRKENNKMALK